MIHYKQKLLEYSSLGRELAGLPYKKSVLKALYKLLEIKLPHNMQFNVTNLPQPNLDTPANIARKLSTFFLLLGTEGALLMTYKGDEFFIKKDGSITKHPDGSLVELVTSVGDPIKLITFDVTRYDNSVPRKQSQRAKQKAKTPFYKTFLNKSVPWQLKIFEKVEAALKELLIRKIKSGNVSKSADIFFTLKFLDDNLNNLRLDPDDAGLRNYFRKSVEPALELTAKHIWPEIINLPRSEQLKKIQEIEKSILEEGNKGYMAIFMQYLLQNIYTFRASDLTESKNNGKILLEYSSLGKELKGLPYKKNLEKYLHTKEEIAHDVEIEKKEIPKDQNEFFRLILSSQQQQDDVVILGSTAALYLTWLGPMPEQVVIHQDKTILNQKLGPILAQKGDPAKNFIDYIERTIGTIKGIFYLKKKKELDAYREKKNKREFKSDRFLVYTTLGLSTKLLLLKKTQEQLSNRFLQVVKKRSYSEKTTKLLNAIRALDRWINQITIHPEEVDQELFAYFLDCIDDAIINTSWYLFKGVGENREKLLKSILKDGNKGHYQVFLQFLRQQMLEKIIKNSGYYVGESKTNNKILLEYSVFGKELKGLPYKKNFEKFYLLNYTHTVPIKVLTVPGPEITNDLDLYKNIWPSNFKTQNIIVGTKGAAIVDHIPKPTVFVVTSKKHIEILPFPKRDQLIIQGLVNNDELQTAIDTIKNAVGEIVKIITVNTDLPRYHRRGPPEQKPKDVLAGELAKKIEPILFSVLQNIEAELSGKMLQMAKNRIWTKNSTNLFKALLILKQWIEQNQIDNSILNRPQHLKTFIMYSVEQAMRMTIAYVYKEPHPIADDYKKLLDSITKKGNEGNLNVFLAFFKQAAINEIVKNPEGKFFESQESFIKESTVLLQEASNLNSVLQDVKNKNSLIKTLYKEWSLTPDVKFTVSPLSNKSMRLKAQHVYILVGDKDAAVLGVLGTWVKVAWRTSPDLNQWAVDEFDTQPAIDVAFSVIGNPKTIIELTPDTNKTEKIVQRRKRKALKLPGQGQSVNFIYKKILPVIRPIIIKSQEIVYDLADITIKNKNHQKAASLLDFLETTDAFLHGLKDIELSQATLYALEDTAEYMEENLDDPNVAKFIHISKPKINREPWILVANEIALGNAKVLKIFLDFFRQRILSELRHMYFESVERTQNLKTELAFLKNKKPLFDILSKNFGIDQNSEYMTLTPEEFFADEILNASVNLVIGTNGVLLFGRSLHVFYMTYFHFDSLGNLQRKANFAVKSSMRDLLNSGIIGKVEKVLLFAWLPEQSKVYQRKLLRTKLPMIKGEKIKNPKIYLYKRFEPIMLKAIENAYNEVQGLLINALKKKNFKKARYLNHKAKNLQNYIVHWPFDQSGLGSNLGQTLQGYFYSALSQAALYLYPESSNQTETENKLIQDIVEGNGQNLAVIWGFFKQLLLSGHQDEEY